MTTLLLLQIYLFVGAIYGLSVVAIAEATHPSGVAAVPLRLRLRVYLAALAAARGKRRATCGVAAVGTNDS